MPLEAYYKQKELKELFRWALDEDRVKKRGLFSNEWIKDQKNKTDQQYRNQRFKKNKQIDTILEKIAASGYESLSKEEKNLLFKSSKK